MSVFRESNFALILPLFFWTAHNFEIGILFNTQELNSHYYYFQHQTNDCIFIIVKMVENWIDSSKLYLYDLEI